MKNLDHHPSILKGLTCIEDRCIAYIPYIHQPISCRSRCCMIYVSNLLFSFYAQEAVFNNHFHIMIYLNGNVV